MSRGRVLLLVLLLLGLPSHAWGQGQLIPGNRTLAGTLNAGVTTGTATAYVLTLNPGITAYVTDQQFTFRVHTGNTGAATLSVSGLAAIPLRKWVGSSMVPLDAGDLPTGREVLVYYDGSVMQVIGGIGATGSPTLTAGAGLSLTGSTLATASTEPDFLTNGGSTALTCGAGQQGKMQVMANGEHQYCDGAATPLLRSGLLTQSGLTWNVTLATCTGDANGGKLTIVGTEIRCAADIGGGAGGVASVFGRTGAVVAQTGDYSAAQVTNAADLTAANVFAHASGQSMKQLLLPGATSGTLTVKAAAVAGTSTLTLPAGTTDFSTTGGASQVVRQSSAGGPLTVGTLSAANLSDGLTGTGTVVLSTSPTLTTPTIARLPNLTTNGYMKTSASNGTLVVQTTVPTTDLSGTLTNAQLPPTLDTKRINPREVSYTDAATVTLNTDTTDVGVLTSLSQDTTFANPTGTPQPGNQVRIKLVSTLPRLITWGTSFSAAAGVPLPTTTTGGNIWDEWGFEWNATLSKWVFIGTTQSSQSARRRTCTILMGADNGAALADADLGPQLHQCEITSQATIEQITIVASGGTPSVIVHRRTDTTSTALLSTALATGSGGAAACARTTATTGYRTTMTCSATLQNTTVSPGDWIGLTSGTATGSPSRVTISISYLLNS